MFEHANESKAFFNGKIMDGEEITHENLNQSPKMAQGFQANRFMKINSNLLIPDTIAEHSGELNNSSLKSEVSKIVVDISSGDHTNGILQSSKCDESSVASTIIPVDNSYIIDCERQVLEYSNDYEEKNKSLNNSVDCDFYGTLSKKLGSFNDTISTPPNELRSQINALRDEIKESDEFHDLEIQILKEDLEEKTQGNYIELIEKYSTLMELYTSLKAEYEAYRNEQENFKQEIHSKTTDCLESLCTQIEASDGSMSFSDASFTSFNAEIKSSTMVGNLTEREITIVNNSALMTDDPLAMTIDGGFKTPKITPLRSCKKNLNLELTNSKKKSLSKKWPLMKDLVIEREDSFQYKTKLMNKISDLQTTLYEKINEIRDLEQRLFKVEDLSNEIQNECDRITNQYIKESAQLKENLTIKSQELDELTQRLITETTALNPLLRDTMVDAPVTKILSTFIETIIEGCKKIQDDLIMKYNNDKAEWKKQKEVDSLLIKDLNVKCKSSDEMYEAVKNELERSKTEMSLLQGEISDLKSNESKLNEIRHDFECTKEKIEQLQTELQASESEKLNVLKECKTLKDINISLEEKINEMENVSEALQKAILTNNDMKLENDKLQERITMYQELETEVEKTRKEKDTFENDLLTTREHCKHAEQKIQELQKDLEHEKSEKLEAIEKFKVLEEQLKNVENISEALEHANSTSNDLKLENGELQEKIRQLDTIIETTKNEKINSEALTIEFQSIKEENDYFKGIFEVLKDKKHLVAKLCSDVTADEKEVTLLDHIKSFFPSELEQKNEIYLHTLNEIISDSCKSLQQFLQSKFTDCRTQWEKENDEGKKLIDELQTANHNLNDQIKNLEFELSELNNVKKCYEERTEEELRLRDVTVKRLDTEILQRDEELKSREFENNKIREELKEAEERIETLQKEVEALNYEKCQYINKYKTLEGSIASLQDRLIQLENISETLEKANSTSNDMKLENEKLQEKIRQLDAIIEIAKEEKINSEALTIEFYSIKKENDHFKSILEVLNNKKHSIAQLCSDLTVDEKAITLLDHIKSSLPSALEHKYEIYLHNLSEIISDSCRSFQQSLENKFADCRAQLEKENDDGKKLISELQLENHNLNDQIKNLELEFSELCNVKKSYEERTEEELRFRDITIKRLDTEVLQWKEELNSREFESNKIREELKGAEDEIEILQKEVEALNYEKSQHIDKYKTLEESIVCLQERLKVLENISEALEKANSTSNELKLENEKLQEKIRQLDTIIETAKKERINSEALKIEFHSIKEENDYFKGIFEVLKDKKRLVAKLCSDVTADEIEATLLDHFKSSLPSKLEQKNEIYLHTLNEIISDSCKSLQQFLESKFTDCRTQWEKENDEKKKLIDELQTANHNLNDQIKNLEFELFEFNNVKKSYEERTDEELRLRDVTVKRLDTEILQRDEELKCREFENNKIREELKEAEERIETLQKKVESLDFEKSQHIDKYKTLEGSIECLQERLIELENISVALEKANSICTDLSSENKKLQKKGKELETLIETLQHELESARKDRIDSEALTNELHSVNEEINNFKSVFDTVVENKHYIAQLYSDLSVDDTAQVFLDKIKSSFSGGMEQKYEVYVNSLNEIISGSCKYLQQSLERKFTDCRAQLEKENDDGKKLISELQSQSKSLSYQVSDLEDKLRELGDMKKSYEEEIQEELKSKEINIKNLEASLAFAESTKEEELKKLKLEANSLKTENKQLKLNNDHLKERVKELNHLINDQSSQGETNNLNNSQVPSKILKRTSARNVDLCTRRLDKLEEINFNLTELVTRILTTTEFPNVEKLKFMSVRDYSNISKKVSSHLDKVVSKVKELEEANIRLDEELDSYAKHIKELKADAVSVWKTNKVKMEALESEIQSLKKENKALESEKDGLLAKVSKLEGECTKLRNAAMSDGLTNTCNSSNDLKQIYDLKRTILVKEQKILELQELENRNSVFKSQIKYLENALEQEKKKIRQEKEKMKKLQGEIEELRKTQKCEKKGSVDSELIDELREKGSLTGGIVQDYVDKENMRKLSKEIRILKELCRARYAEIRRLEAENTALKNIGSKNSNQMDSPLRLRSYNTRSKNVIGKELWKPDSEGKENRL